MRVVAPVSPCGRICPPDSLVTFVVLESGSCKIPVMTSPSRHELTPRTLDDDDYMSEMYSYPLHDDELSVCDERTMNMRVDIKLKVAPGTVEPGLTYPTKLSYGGAIAPPSTPINSENAKYSYDYTQSRECDVIENNYDGYCRDKKSTMRNRSAPPVTSQYRIRLSNTSQWIKKRAVAELTSARKSRGRPATSVRPFSERENSETPQLSKVILEPTQKSQTPMPDMGSFRGKPPISITKRPTSFKHPRILTASKDPPGPCTNHSSSRADHLTEASANNKVDQYVSELRKTIKMRKPGMNGRKKMTPFAVWAISGAQSTVVSPDLEIFENEIVNQERFLDDDTLQISSSDVTKMPETHAVRKEVIRQIAAPDQEDGRRSRLEVKGDAPSSNGSNADRNQANTSTENAAKTSRNAFPPNRASLSSAAKRGTKRYARQLLIKSSASPLRPFEKETGPFQQFNGFLPTFEKNARTLPFIKLRQPVTDYKTYKQNSAPFVRTLI